MLNIYDLKCENIYNPKGINKLNPRFRWKIKSDNNNVYQEFYEINVYDESENIVWNSGKVRSDKVFNVTYQGEKLLPGCKYTWEVRVYDNYENSKLSDKNEFYTGKFNNSNWSAKWIKADTIRKQSNDCMNPGLIFSGKVTSLENIGDYLNPSIYMRKLIDIKADKNIKKALAYATAHGVYELSINGQSISEEFAPGYTAYEKYLQYQQYDITNILKQGENAIGIVLSDGWYTGKIGLMGIGNQHGDDTAFLAQVEVEYEDGSTEVFETDESFKWSTGAYVYSDIFVGEKYDARLEPKGWQQTDFDDSQWKNVVVENYGYSNLTTSICEPVRKIETYKPKAIIKTPKGETVIDVGANIVGRIKFRLKGNSGNIIGMEHSEVLDKDGNFLFNIMGQNKNQKDYYIFKGEGIEEYEPKFTFHGFRYVKISGDIVNLNLDDFEVIVLGSDLQKTGEFECSHEGLTQLQDNIFRSQRGNMLAVPTDCPQRERAGWTGDMQVYAPTACYNMDVQGFLESWLDNMKLEQLNDGQIPNVIPTIKSNSMIDGSKGHIASAGWGDACVIVPYELYKKYGDINILEKYFDMMTKWMNYVEKQASTTFPESLENMSAKIKERQKYLWNTEFHFGDWLVPSIKNDQGKFDPMLSAKMTNDIVPTTMYAYTTKLMTEICEILGENEKSEYYKTLNRNIRKSFSDEYIDEDGRIAKNLQGIYVLALQMDMIEEDKKEKSIEKLVELIKQNNNCLDTGFLSVPFILDVLCNSGKSDIAYSILFQNQCPSWLYEVENGATTIWEAWNAILPDGTRMNASYNHFAFGCVGDFMYRKIAGINCEEVGYKKIRIEPDFDCGLNSAYGEYNSNYGNIVSKWEIKDNIVSIYIEIPPNTDGTIVLSNDTAQGIIINEEILKDNKVSIVDHKKYINIGNGKFNIKYELQNENTLLNTL